MQLFALDSEKQVISASHASKQCDYFCLECEKTVRLRGGAHRQDHFYHLRPDPACRQSRKSLIHLQLQNHLADQLPKGEWGLERRFPEICRVADLAWEAKKLIFEVQCSPITAQEVEERIRDYNSLGYQVVWILHDARFNRIRVTGAEVFLQGYLHYFSNMNAEGKGTIYDQLQVIHKGIRRFAARSGVVSCSQPVFHEGRVAFFSEDFTDLLKRGDSKAEAAKREFEKAKALIFTPKKSRSFLKSAFQFYLNLFHLILEKCCH